MWQEENYIYLPCEIIADMISTIFIKTLSLLSLINHKLRRINECSNIKAKWISIFMDR